VAQLLPLGGSSLALVATLLTITVSADAPSEVEDATPSDTATALVLLVTASVLPPQTPVGSGEDMDEGGSDGEEPGPDPEQELERSATTLAEALRMVFGLEEAWDEARREARELFLGGKSEESGQPGRGAMMIAAVDAALERWSPWCDLLAPKLTGVLRVAARAASAAMEAIEDAGRPDPSAAPVPATVEVASEERVETAPPSDGEGQRAAMVAMVLIVAADQARRQRRRRNGTTARGSLTITDGGMKTNPVASWR
jgi:hypothetical protein